jgi:hypothetical protein
MTSHWAANRSLNLPYYKGSAQMTVPTHRHVRDIRKKKGHGQNRQKRETHPMDYSNSNDGGMTRERSHKAVQV